MATPLYFSGITELRNPYGLDNSKFAAAFPGVKGRRWDSFQRLVGRDVATGALLPVTRTIFFKSNPSLHKCGPRCLNATGHDCECSCGGKNHGAGR
jgi:hypothetical protein